MYDDYDYYETVDLVGLLYWRARRNGISHDVSILAIARLLDMWEYDVVDYLTEYEYTYA